MKGCFPWARTTYGEKSEMYKIERDVQPYGKKKRNLKN